MGEDNDGSNDPGNNLMVDFTPEEVESIIAAAYKPWQRSSGRVLAMIADKIQALTSEAPEFDEYPIPNEG